MTTVPVLIDDLGFADIQPNGPWSPTPFIGSLADEGVLFSNMHAYKYCSPSRRSLLSGRFPVHISGKQAPVCSNFLPLQMTLLSEKMKRANFTTHFIGKGHLGYQTTDHLPVNRGFDTHYGFLQGDEQYERGLSVKCDVPELVNLPAASWCGQWPPRVPRDKCNLDFWLQNSTAPDNIRKAVTYSTSSYANETVALIRTKKPNEPMFIYLAWQAVHGPWVLPDVPKEQLLQPGDPGYSNYCCNHSVGNEYLSLPDPTQQPDNALVRTQVMRCQFGSMLKVLDTAMANITAALKSAQLWDNTLMLIMADNGGVGPGNNWPMRGQKSTPWQGGTRVAAIATGGYIPLHLRGGTFPVTVHFADIYPTLSKLVGVSPADDVMLDGALRTIDGLDFWPFLLNSTMIPTSGETLVRIDPLTELREYLPTTEFSIIYNGRWKLITQADLYTSYWTPSHGRGPNNTAIATKNRTAWPCVNTSVVARGGCLICAPRKPCLFDLKNDISERINLATEYPGLVTQLSSQLARYTPYVDGKMTSTELARYECIQPKGGVLKWWGNFTGPCCRPKKVNS